MGSKELEMFSISRVYKEVLSRVSVIDYGKYRDTVVAKKNAGEIAK
jgi:hypothetical protein